MKKNTDRLKRDKKVALVRTDEGTTLLSAASAEIRFNTPVTPSSSLRNAISKLSELEERSQLRADAIRNGKFIIENWRPPTEQEIDKIIANMKKRLLA
jgi:hypothetical protein